MRFGYSDRCLEHDTGERHPENPDRLRAIRRGLAKRHGVEYAEADPRRAKRLSRSTTRSMSTNWRRSSPTAAGAGTPTPSRARGRGTPPSPRPASHSGRLDPRSTAPTVETPRLRSDGRRATTRCPMTPWVLLFQQRRRRGPDRPRRRGRRPGRSLRLGRTSRKRDPRRILRPRRRVLRVDSRGRTLSGYRSARRPARRRRGGTTVNLPLSAGAGDADYLYAIDEAVAPAIERFDPDP